MRMQGKHIPEKEASVDPIQNAPDDSRRAFSYSFAKCKPFLCESPTGGMPADMNVVGKREARSPSAAITQIASDPYRVYAFGFDSLQDSRQDRSAPHRRVSAIAIGTAIAIGIETVLKA
ncbi:hypothetical protein [Methylocella tundrae]|uniref:hypothetical protein n=1 Tax=Methylocella tundrae TaxID=227605 RepID=UPI001FCE6589|nr:hypothetical protein [Methylocella tundrae]